VGGPLLKRNARGWEKTWRSETQHLACVAYPDFERSAAQFGFRVDLFWGRVTARRRARNIGCGLTLGWIVSRDSASLYGDAPEKGVEEGNRFFKVRAGLRGQEFLHEARCQQQLLHASYHL